MAAAAAASSSSSSSLPPPPPSRVSNYTNLVTHAFIGKGSPIAVVHSLIPEIDDVALNDNIVVQMDESPDLIAAGTLPQNQRREITGKVHRRRQFGPSAGGRGEAG